MLPPAARLRQRDEFVAVLRRGRRAARGSLVVHLLRAPGLLAPALLPTDGTAPVVSAGPRVGLVVGRAVGGAVRRNEVSRRLRHLMRPRLAGLPSDAQVVIRALPAAAGRSSAALAGDLDAALARLVRTSA